MWQSQYTFSSILCTLIRLSNKALTNLTLMCNCHRPPFAPFIYLMPPSMNHWMLLTFSFFIITHNLFLGCNTLKPSLFFVSTSCTIIPTKFLTPLFASLINNNFFIHLSHTPIDMWKTHHSSKNSERWFSPNLLGTSLQNLSHHI